jgi:acyl dehydratase
MPAHLIDSIDRLKNLLGQEVGISGWFTVEQERLDAFATATGDRQWIHLDSCRANDESPYRSTIAHGFLTLSLISHLHAEAVELRVGQKLVINYGLNRVRFPAPVPAGARIRSRSTLKDLVELENAVQLTWLIKVEVEGKPKPALVAEWIVRLCY